MHDLCWGISVLTYKDSPLFKGSLPNIKGLSSPVLANKMWYRQIMVMCLPIFGNEGFDAINFPLLISLLLRAQSLLGV